MSKDKRIAIIPARSGSKGLVDKNIKPLSRKPLIAYTIEAALESECFDCVFVSTDSEEYAQIAKKYGAHVPFLRSSKHAADNVSAWGACVEVFDKIEDKYDVLALLQPTSPLRTSKDIQKAFELYYEKEAQAVLSVCETHHPLQWCNELPQNLSLKNFVAQEHKNKGRQQLSKSYQLNGAIYILQTKLLSNDVDLYDLDSYAYVMDKMSSIDIDDELDFLYAQTLIEAKF